MASDHENMPLNKLLPMYLDKFITDFSFRDIEHDLIQAETVLTSEEIKRISDISNSEHQIILMFFFLCEKEEKDIDKFINILDRLYDWLNITHLSMRRLEPEERRYIELYDTLGKVESKHQDINVHRLDYFSELRSSLMKLKANHYVVLFGNLGCGKKWLAIDVCKDYGVLKSTNFSIHWLDMSDCTDSDKYLEKLKAFACQFSSIDLNQSKEKITNDIKIEIKTHYRESLLVLIDVQKEDIIKYFDFDTKVLITTRNKDVRDNFSKKSSKVINIGDSFTDPEGKELLQKASNTMTTQHDTCMEKIIKETKKNPFLLSMVAKDLEGKPKQVWKQALEDSRTNSLMLNKIHNSLNNFNDSEKELFGYFVVFQHSVVIPVELIAKLCGKGYSETEKILEKFDKNSVVDLYYENNTRVCTQKYIYFQYLRNNPHMNVNISRVHRKLVDIYDLEDVLENPKDSTSFIKNDGYFYYFIGYHLQKAGMDSMLQRLYLDFRFLGKHIKVNGCQKTCGDFERYRKEIIGEDEAKEKLYNDLLIFLPTIEEYISDHSDSNLLHYALNSNIKVIADEARRQASRIPNSVFFDSKGFQDGKQFCRIRGVPTHVKLLNPDKCLISTASSETYLADLYLGYNTKPTFLVKKSMNIVIVKSEIFKDKFLLTLDSKGTLATWDIAHEKQRIVKRASSTRLVDAINSHIPEKSIASKQEMDSNSKIECYHLNERTGKLLTANSLGIIEMKTWDEIKHLFAKEPTFQNTLTRLTNLVFIHALETHHCLVINQDGDGYHVHLVHFTDSFVNECKVAFEPNQGKLVDVLCKEERIFYLIFERMCYSLEFWPSIEFSYDHKLEHLFSSKHTIKCSQIWKNSENQYFLILGTSKNLLIYDIKSKKNVLWCYSEKPVICLDIHPIEDEGYQSIIIAGLYDKQFLQIHALTHDLNWGYENNASKHFPPNVRIKSGKNDFGVSYHGTDDICAMFAIDTENKLHKFYGDLEPITQNVPGNVSVLAAGAKNCFVGCDSGEIYGLKNDSKMNLDAPSSITFMKVIDNFIVASTKSNSIIFHEIHEDQGFSTDIDCKIIDALRVKNNVVAVVTANSICLWNINNTNRLSRMCHTQEPGKIQHADIQNNTLVYSINSNPPTVYIYNVENFTFQLVLKHTLLQVRSEITKIALSHNAQVFAVGYQSGNIEIYQTKPRIQLLFVLRSHKTAISDLKFSPWDNSYPTLPIVLASCSEQLCFWDISYAIRNKIQPDNLNKQSSRFFSPSRPDKSSEAFRYPDLTTQPSEPNPWIGKSGISGKPELLACIKFNGNKAEKLCCNDAFTRFNTIDDTGGYYDLHVQNKIVSSES